MNETARVAAVRLQHGVAAVPGATAPYDRVHVRLHYPARQPSGAALDSGDVEVAAGAADLPLVLMLGGVNCGPEAYQWLAHGLAADGFAVATYSFPAETRPGRISLVPDDGFDDRLPPGRVIRAVLAAVWAINERKTLSGAVDPSRLGLVGHSAGGRVALRLTENADPAPAAVASYAGHAARAGPAFPPIAARCPVLMMAGGADGVIDRSRGRYQVPNATPWDPVRYTFESALPARDGDHVLFTLPAATHFTFVSPGDPAAGRAFLEQPDASAEHHRDLLLNVLGAFFGRHLRGDDAARLDAALSVHSALCEWR